MNNIFIIEFKRILKPTIYWSVGISALIFTSMIFYQQMIENGMLNQLKSIMESPFIGDMLKGFGIKPEQLGDVLGFYAARNADFYMMLMGSMYSMIMASSLLSIEEYEKTSEFLLTRPVTRTEVISGKILAYHINLLALNIFIDLIGFISLEIFKQAPYNFNSFLILCIYSYLLHIVFGAVGLVISIIVKRGRMFNGAVIGIVMGTYFLKIISNITESADFIGLFSPFKYIRTDVLTPGYTLELWHLALFFIFTIILLFISYKIYNKKDILL